MQWGQKLGNIPVCHSLHNVFQTTNNFIQRQLSMQYLQYWQGGAPQHHNSEQHNDEGGSD